jgi:hypothetical protein
VIIEYQAAIYNLLSTLQWPVYDQPPQDAPLPYITIGDDRYTQDDDDTTNAWQITSTVHCWAGTTGEALGQPGVTGNKPVQLMQKAVFDLLNRLDDGLIVSGYYVSGVSAIYAEVLRDPDGVTRHGVQQFQINICEV